MPGTRCPLAAGELSTIVGKKLTRVDLSGEGDPSGQCAFSAVTKGAAASPQIYLTFSPGGIGGLRDDYRYYLKVRNQLAARPEVSARPDLGPGSFTLTVQNNPITTVFFLSGDSIATYTVDLTGAPHADKPTLTKLIELLLERPT